MKKRAQFKVAAIIAIFATLIGVILVNVISAYLNKKVDLTQDNRFSLSQSTIDLIKSTDDVIYIKVLMNGDALPKESQLLVESINERAKEILDELKDVSTNVQYEFVNPLEGKTDEKEIRSILENYVHEGLIPKQMGRGIQSDGNNKIQWLIPGAIISYKGEKKAALLWEEDFRGRYLTEEYSNMRMEYNLVRAIKALVKPHKSKVAFIQGHDELDWTRTAWMASQLGDKLKDYYSVEYARIDGQVNSLRNIAIADSAESTIKDMGNKYDLLIIAQPKRRIRLADQFVIDQHIMRGGKVLWLIDASTATLDSLEKTGTIYVQPNEVMSPNHDDNLTNLLFEYGVRFQPDLIMDIKSIQPLIMNGKTFAFPYMLNLQNFGQHPITGKIEQVRSNFAGTINFVNDGADGLKKTVLAQSSDQAKYKPVPEFVSLMEGINKPIKEQYTHQYPVAVLVEGSFHSYFDGHLPISFLMEEQFNFIPQGKPTKQIFISDGDIISNYVDYPLLSQFVATNQFLYQEQFLRNEGIYPLGCDPHTNHWYDNTEFVLNCIDYLCGNEDFTELRAKIIQIGKLKDTNKSTKLKYQILNVGLPLLLLLLLGIGITVSDRIRYARPKRNLPKADMTSENK